MRNPYHSAQYGTVKGVLRPDAKRGTTLLLLEIPTFTYLLKLILGSVGCASTTKCVDAGANRNNWMGSRDVAIDLCKDTDEFPFSIAAGAQRPCLKAGV